MSVYENMGACVCPWWYLLSPVQVFSLAVACIMQYVLSAVQVPTLPSGCVAREELLYK